MPAPTITPLPPAPLRSQSPSTFTATAEAFVDALEDLPGEVNAFAAYLDSLGIDPSSIPELARDALAAALVEGAGIEIVVDDVGNTITISASFTASDAATMIAAAVAEVDVYTDEQARDAVAIALTPGTGLAKSVDDAGDTITLKIAKRGFSFQITGTAPTASEVLFAWSPRNGETVTFADDFAGCFGLKISGGTNPASTYALDVKKNGVSVGTISISTSGVVTMVTSGTTVAVTGGTDILTIVGNATPDSGALGYTFTMAGDLA